jgi:hypothetical protein
MGLRSLKPAHIDLCNNNYDDDESDYEHKENQGLLESLNVIMLAQYAKSIPLTSSVLNYLDLLKNLR